MECCSLMGYAGYQPPKKQQLRQRIEDDAYVLQFLNLLSFPHVPGLSNSPSFSFQGIPPTWPLTLVRTWLLRSRDCSHSQRSSRLHPRSPFHPRLLSHGDTLSLTVSDIYLHHLPSHTVNLIALSKVGGHCASSARDLACVVLHR